MDSAASTKPTGMPITSAGRATPSAASASTSRSAVGALPSATTAPSSRGPKARMAQAARVRPVRFDSSTIASSAIRHSSVPP